MPLQKFHNSFYKIINYLFLTKVTIYVKIAYQNISHSLLQGMLILDKERIVMHKKNQENHLLP